MDNYKVYIHTNKINGKKYVGCTKQDVKKRWEWGYGYSNNKLFFEDILRYGWNNFEHKVVAKEMDKKTALLLEETLIEKYSTCDKDFGYNISPGMNRVAEETKIKISIANSGENNYFYGKRFSMEDKAKKSERMRGEKNPFYGKHHTAESRKKMSDKLKGRKPIQQATDAKSKKVICIETKTIYYSILDAERKTKANHSSIIRCCKKKQDTANGYHWAYYDEKVGAI